MQALSESHKGKQIKQDWSSETSCVPREERRLPQEERAQSVADRAVRHESECAMQRLQRQQLSHLVPFGPARPHQREDRTEAL